jgi:hypothetical protein
MKIMKRRLTIFNNKQPSPCCRIQYRKYTQIDALDSIQSCVHVGSCREAI